MSRTSAERGAHLANWITEEQAQRNAGSAQYLTIKGIGIMRSRCCLIGCALRRAGNWPTLTIEDIAMRENRWCHRGSGGKGKRPHCSHNGMVDAAY